MCHTHTCEYAFRWLGLLAFCQVAKARLLLQQRDLNNSERRNAQLYMGKVDRTSADRGNSTNRSALNVKNAALIARCQITINLRENEKMLGKHSEITGVATETSDVQGFDPVWSNIRHNGQKCHTVWSKRTEPRRALLCDLICQPCEMQRHGPAAPPSPNARLECDHL